MSRRALLFLCHRIPFPPDKGDKIRSFNILQFLSARFDIYLAAFVDDSRDLQYRDKVASLCSEVKFVEIAPVKQRVKSLVGFARNTSLSEEFYWSREMADWVKEVEGGHEDLICFAFCTPMAQYLVGRRAVVGDQKKVVDAVDVDSQKWGAYAREKSWPLSWVFARESKKLLCYEQQVASRVDSIVFVSEAEAELFGELAPESKEKVGHFYNGVDLEFFSPEHELPSPYSASARPLVFTGAMDYWPNVDAVRWFTEEVLPRLREKSQAIEFWIVGSKPSGEVKRLAELDGVYVTGRVDDVRPYLKHALAAVAPMRIARGIQNKVLEAMAMAKPVVVSKEGADGIYRTAANCPLKIVNTPEEYSVAIESLSNDPQNSSGISGRRFVEEEFRWDVNLESLLSQLSYR